MSIFAFLKPSGMHKQEGKKNHLHGTKSIDTMHKSC